MYYPIGWPKVFKLGLKTTNPKTISDDEGHQGEFIEDGDVIDIKFLLNPTSTKISPMIAVITSTSLFIWSGDMVCFNPFFFVCSFVLFCFVFL
jgi:hypothetical protein